MLIDADDCDEADDEVAPASDDASFNMFAGRALAEFPGALQDTETGFKQMIQDLTSFGFKGLEDCSRAHEIAHAKRQE